MRLGSGDPPAATLSLVAGIALHAAAQDSAGESIVMQLKWPNDLLVGSAKLGGILLERSGDAVVCGIGVNLGWAPTVAGRATVSLANLGIRVPVDKFAARLAERFATSLARWRTLPLATVRDEWLARAHPRGTPISRADSDGTQLTGAFDGLEEDGSLRLRAADGAVHVVRSGEVLLG